MKTSMNRYSKLKIFLLTIIFLLNFNIKSALLCKKIAESMLKLEKKNLINEYLKKSYKKSYCIYFN